MTISVSGKLPAGDGNGLVAILSELVRDDKQVFVGVVLVDGKKITIDRDSGEIVPTVRIRRIEVILDPEDRVICRRLLERALDKRTGREALPYDLAAELDAAFGSEDVTDYQEDPGTA